MANTNDKPTCGQCAQLRQSDGYCRKKGYINSLREAPAKCFISREEAKRMQAETPLTPKEAKPMKEPIPAEMKRCPRCGQYKHMSEFCKSSKSGDGLQTYCRDCHRTMQGKRPVISDEERAQATAATLTAGEKTCPNCGRTLPLDRFSRHRRSADGFSTICIECRGMRVAAGIAKRKAVKKDRKEFQPEDVKGMEFKVKIDNVEPADRPMKPDYRPKKQSTTKSAIIMKPVKVYYERCINLGDYENEKIGIEVELEDGDTVTKAVEVARERIRILTGTKNIETEWERNERIANDPSQPYSKVCLAKKWLEDHPDQKPEELPF